MERGGERRRRVWRWAVTVWATAVVVGGGLTLWLQESNEPRGPYVWQDANETPAPGQDGFDGFGPCPPPGSSPPPAEGQSVYACAYVDHL